jgi:hypothetical protein
VPTDEAVSVTRLERRFGLAVAHVGHSVLVATPRVTSRGKKMT